MRASSIACRSLPRRGRRAPVSWKGLPHAIRRALAHPMQVGAAAGFILLGACLMAGGWVLGTAGAAVGAYALALCVVAAGVILRV
ncbi:MAG: hypothetical protein IMX02_10585 [Limnochordaceae bacterium]|nr:hypothetical protein [Limnochordaceae bacterium]